MNNQLNTQRRLRALSPSGVRPPAFSLLGGGTPSRLVGLGVLVGNKGEALTYTRTGSKFAFNVDFTRGAAVAADLPCVDARGIALEAAHTNLVLRSEEIDSASWVKTGGAGAAAPVVTANQSGAPDGTPTADLVVFDATSSAGQRSDISQSFATNAATYTTQFWIRGENGTTGTLFLLWFDGSIVPKISVPFTSDWVLFRSSTSLNANAGSGFSLGYEINNYSAPGSIARVYLWGAQIEQNGYARTYVPTAGATATAGADSAAMGAVSIAELPVARGIVSFVLTPMWTTTAGATVFDTRTAGPTDGIRVYVAANGAIGFVRAGDAAVESGALTWVGNTPYRIAVVWDAGIVKMFRNDVLVHSASSVTMPAAHNGFRLGAVFDGTLPLDGFLSDLRFSTQ